MAKTPEGKVKDALKAELISVGIHPWMDVALGKAKHPDGIFYMPVAGAHSVHGIHDFIGNYKGKFWSMETKAPDNPCDETVHQGYFRMAVTDTGGFAMSGVRDAKLAVSALLAHFNGEPTL
jgi:hypothetical protein